MTRLPLLLAFLAVPARSAVVPQDAPCFNYGDHTEAIPEFDVMNHTCRQAPLEDPAAFSAAWTKLLAKVQSGGGPLMPVEGGEVQLGRARGNAIAASLDENRHWGDIAYVQYKSPSDRRMPSVVYLVTYRTAKVNGALTAVRADFQIGGDARLHAVHVWHGVKLPGAPSMAWSQGPVSTYNQESSLDGWWAIRFRQLVASWAAD